ncbi:MAG: 4-hydroxy-3-methylbut-2-enyl diphosphate reductase [Spirochaetaceae bacterium]|nr:4-hydroxy-3-methylbut-2-enyl diphosphate reductase [Spirochaetaceae bacterium]
MTLIRAKVLGFCMGVRRAVEIAQAALAAARAEPGCVIYTLGPLIHNPQVLDSLAGQGIRILEEGCLFSDRFTEVPSPDLSGAVVIIRAHGIDPETEQKLREGGARIIDATCLRVKASQLAALEMAEKGYRIFLAGESDHAELKGIYGYALEGAARAGDDSSAAGAVQAGCIIVGNPQEAKAAAVALLEREPLAKTALIGQTTISEDEYKMTAEAIKEIFPNLEVKNTICQATRERQNALRELCSQADAVIIAGGKDSANTRRLLSIAQGCGKKAWLVESASALPVPDEINDACIPAGGVPAIGISAGASTPDSVIAEIESALCPA